MKFLEELASRRRFGMRPGLDAITSLCNALGNPERSLKAIHIAGTNGKGATAAILDASLRACGFRVARYTSPHLVNLNERFFIDGRPIIDAKLEDAAVRVARAAPKDLTFFEALTGVAFLAFAEADVDFAILETGLGGRLDATNICHPVLSVITRIGLDHCDWLGDTVEKIASEKAGIIKPGVDVVVGENSESVRRVFEETARSRTSHLFYAPDLASEEDIPQGFSLQGSFNRENAVTALAALKTLNAPERALEGFSKVIWPGRFQKVGSFIIDGAHNPPAACALKDALLRSPHPDARYILVAGFCGDKDVEETLSILAPLVKRAFAVRTNNPRSLEPEALAAKMRSCGIEAEPCNSLQEALSKTNHEPSLVCGSLFLAGEALVALDAFPYSSKRFDPAEILRPSHTPQNMV